MKRLMYRLGMRLLRMSGYANVPDSVIMRVAEPVVLTKDYVVDRRQNPFWNEERKLEAEKQVLNYARSFIGTETVTSSDKVFVSLSLTVQRPI